MNMKHLRQKLEFIKLQIQDIKRTNQSMHARVSRMTTDYDSHSVKIDTAAEEIEAALAVLEGYALALEDTLGDIKLTKE
jgi:uncharacterized protein YoxC